MFDLHPKTWGSEDWIVNNDHYCAKVLNLNRGFRCSRHMHEKKTETFVVITGLVLMHVNNSYRVLVKNDIVTIEPGEYHYFEGLRDSCILEVSTHHEDSDSVREDQSGPMDREYVFTRFDVPEPREYPDQFGSLVSSSNTTVPYFVRMLNFLYSNFVRDLGPRVIIDTGFGWGASILYWLHEFPDAEIYCIDPLMPGKFGDAVNVVDSMDSTYRDRFHFVLGKIENMEFLPEVRDVVADFIFLDADHEYPSTLNQLRILWERLRPGGILMGHDMDTAPEVKLSVHVFCREQGLEFQNWAGDDGCGWFMIRKPLPAFQIWEQV